jgi:predicted transcriptional regulator
MTEINEIGLIHALLDNIRKKAILQLLDKPMNISELMEGAGLQKAQRSVFCYHLNMLEKIGLLKSKYVILKMPHPKGKAGRIYEINHDRLIEALDVLDEYQRDYRKRLSIAWKPIKD